MTRSRDSDAGGAGIIFEFVQIGAYVKASAVDTASGVEVSITAPASSPQDALKRAARRKLEYVLAKRAKGGRGGLVV